MKEKNRKYFRLRKIETKINKNLFIVCGIVTIITMIMIVIEFFSRGTFPPIKIGTFYIGVLILYALHKETLRWIGDRKQFQRQGEVFVYGWIILTTVLYLINFLSKNYFSYSALGEPLAVLREVTVTALEVLAIFILTRGLKLLKNLLK